MAEIEKAFVFEPDRLLLYCLGNWTVKYSLFSGSDLTIVSKDWLQVSVEGFARTLGLGDSWKITVPYQRIAEVHEAIQRAYVLRYERCKTPSELGYLALAKESLLALQECLPSDWRNWHEEFKAAPEVAEGEYLRGPMEVFRLHLPGAYVERETVGNGKKVYVFSIPRSSRLKEVLVSSGFIVRYDGEEYHALDIDLAYGLEVLVAEGDVSVRHRLDVNSLFVLLMKIAKPKDYSFPR